MSAIHDLIGQISDPRLRERLTFAAGERKGLRLFRLLAGGWMASVPSRRLGRLAACQSPAIFSGWHAKQSGAIESATLGV